MHLSASFITLAASLMVTALPIRRAANSTDVLVLQFADVLEQLEAQFYAQALAKFQAPDFTAAGFSDVQVPVQQFTAIGSDEATHAVILEQTILSLGAQPITGCQFNFDSVLTDVATMAATARVVENLGVAAYLGAAHLISDPVILTAAGSILTVEARHQTILNVLNGGSAIPQAFDIAFSPGEVLAVASPFISGCEIPIPANPTLTVTNTGTVAPGTMLTFSSPALNSIDPSTLSCQMMLGGASFSIVLPYTQCVVPQNVNGPVALYITNSTQPLANNIRDQETNDVVAGPTMAFIDTVPEDLGSLARTGSSSSSSSSGSSGSSSSDSSVSSAVSSTDSASASVASSTDGATLSLPSAASATVTASIGSSTSTTTLTPQDANSIISSIQATASPSASPIDNNAGPATSVVGSVATIRWSSIASLPTQSASS